MKRRIRAALVDGPLPQDRPRQWKAYIVDRGSPVTLLAFAVLDPGEHLTEQVPQRTIAWETWEKTHADYGLDVDGARLED